MRTDHLIAALVADANAPRVNPKRVVWLALGLGMVPTVVAFAWLLGMRGDLSSALLTWRFGLKLALICAALVAAWIDCVRYMRPEVPPSVHGSTVLVGVLLVAAVVMELVATPRMEWGAKLIGSNSLICLVAIPALALAPLLALLWAMRRGAPASPLWAGVAVGRLAASAAAALYALHCFDDSPLFVATWYLAAMLIVAVIGAVIGARLLKW